MNNRTAAFTTLLLFSSAYAGEIVIIQPAGQESRSEKESSRMADKARQRSSQQTGPIIIEDGETNRGSDAERASREAQEYQRTPGGQSQPGDTTTIILRSVPLSDAEKARQKAASYVQPAGSSASNRPCGDVSLTIGTVGDKTVIERKANVNERGNSAVNVNCRK